MNKVKIPYEKLNLMCSNLKHVELFQNAIIPYYVSQEEKLVIIDILEETVWNE